MNVLILLLIAVLLICFITCMNGFVLIFLVTGITIIFFKWLNGFTILVIGIIQICLINRKLKIKKLYKRLLSCLVMFSMVVYIFLGTYYSVYHTEIIVGRELKKNEEKYNELIQYMKQNYKHSGTLSYDIYIREEITIFKIWQNKVKTEETFPLYQDEGLYMLLTDLYGTNIKYMEFYFDENGYMAARISVKTIENGKDEEGTDKYILYSLLYWEPEYSGDSPSAGTREYCIENTHLKGSWYAWSKKYLAG